MNLKTKKIIECTIDAQKSLRKLDNRLVGTRCIIEVALRNAAITKQSKVLMIVELMQKTTNGEFQ